MIDWLAPIAWHYVVVGFGKDDVKEARVGIRFVRYFRFALLLSNNDDVALKRGLVLYSRKSSSLVIVD
jgi:hypothetical protein